MKTTLYHIMNRIGVLWTQGKQKGKMDFYLCKKILLILGKGVSGGRNCEEKQEGRRTQEILADPRTDLGSLELG